MKNSKKPVFLFNCITLFIGFIIADIVNNYLGFNNYKIFSLDFTKSVGMYILIYILVYFLASVIRDIWQKHKSDNLILIIIITFAVISIMLSASSMIVPNFLYGYPIVFICLGIVNLINGIKQLKGNNKTIGKLLIILSVFIFTFALKELVSQGYLVFDLF